MNRLIVALALWSTACSLEKGSTGYPHPNWSHTLDYPGPCDGRSRLAA